jgi:hypothetical protein
MNHSKTSLASSLALLATLAPAALAQTTLLSDNFSTDTSSSYFSGGFASGGTGGTPGSFNVGGGRMNITSPYYTTAGSFGYLIAGRSFTTALPALATNDSITFSANITITSISAPPSGNFDSAIFFALANKGAVSSATGTYGGIGAAINPLGGAGKHTSFRDNGTNSTFFAGNDVSYGAFNNLTAPVVDTVYTWSVTITKQAAADTYALVSTFSGNSTTSTSSATLSGTALSNFDSVVIGWNKATATSPVQFSVDNLLVTTSAIPEPSAFAALAGLAGLGFAATRRRR